MGKHLDALKTVLRESKDMSVWKPLVAYGRSPIQCRSLHKGTPCVVFLILVISPLLKYFVAAHCLFQAAWPGLLSQAGSNLSLLRVVYRLAQSAGSLLEMQTLMPTPDSESAF